MNECCKQRIDWLRHGGFGCSFCPECGSRITWEADYSAPKESRSPHGEKVYCSECKYFLSLEFPVVPDQYICLHPSNEKVRHTWRKREVDHVSTPDVLNANNNCYWYDPKRNG